MSDPRAVGLRWVVTMVVAALASFLVEWSYQRSVPPGGADWGSGDVRALLLAVVLGTVPLWTLPARVSVRLLASLAFACVMLPLLGVYGFVHACSINSGCVLDPQGKPTSPIGND